jgi:protocatechuate 3,4-dioxygenase beta subunit
MTLRAWTRARALVVVLVIAMLAAIAVPLAAIPASAATGTVSGNVFDDLDVDGVDDGASEAGIAGAVVRVYGSSGLLGSGTSDASGNYSISINSGSDTTIRVELQTWPAGYEPTRYGSTTSSTNQTTVRFVPFSGNTSGHNFGLQKPGEYCQSNPNLATTAFCGGNPLLSGITDGEYSVFEANYSSSTRTGVGLVQTTGSVNGVAWDPVNARVYTAAYVKRHAGLSSNGIGAVYSMNPATNTTAFWFNVTSLGIDVGQNNYNGANPFPTNAARGLTANSVYSEDPIFDEVGKYGIGDIDTNDVDTLYLTNLYGRTVHALPIPVGGGAPTSQTSLGMPGSAVTCNAGTGTARPFALTYKDGYVYAGVVCDAATGVRADLDAYVVRTPATGAGSGTWAQFGPRIDLDYDKGPVFSSANSSVTFANNRWNIWDPTFDNSWDPGTSSSTHSGGTRNDDYIFRPTPMLSDIEFDDDGSLILAFRDRTTDQLGSFNAPPNAEDSTGTYPFANTTSISNPRLVHGMSGGDILRVCNVAGTWVIDGAAATCPNHTEAGAVGDNNQGPNGGEFYAGDINGSHTEISFGHLALAPRTGQVLLSSMNAEDGTVNSGGVRGLSNSTGARIDSISANYYVATERPSVGGARFAKANGMGDLEVLCDAAPLEIGNRVWVDTDTDGIQDPGENGIDGVSVQLFASTDTSFATPLGTAVTQNGGQYYFTTETARAGTSTTDNVGGGLALRTAYVIRIGTAANYGSGGPLAGYLLTTPNASPSYTYAGDADTIDSDPVAGSGTMGSAWFPTIAVSATSTLPGKVNHTYDVGFYLAPVIPSRDLALVKTVASASPVAGWNGGTVTFNLTITNQGGSGESVNGITIADYIDTRYFAPLTLPPAQSGTVADSASVNHNYTWTTASPSSTTVPTAYIDGVLAPGASVTIPLTLTVAIGDVDGNSVTNSADITAAMSTGLINNAEISRFDTDGDYANGSSSTGAVYDRDSVPDTTPTDTFVTDDLITGTAYANTSPTPAGYNAAVDEDDHDRAVIPLFDLALIKVRAGAQSAYLNSVPANGITFNVTVKNQGAAPVYRVTVQDYLDSAGALAMGTNPASQTVSGHTITYSAGVFTVDNLAAGESVTFPVVVNAASFTASRIINRAEITSFDNDNNSANAKPSWVIDIDSTPDTTPGDTTSTGPSSTFPEDSHNTIDNAPVNGPNASDEDDYDTEAVEFARLRIGSTVYKDADGDDVGDVGEEVPGVRVQLFRQNGATWDLVGTTVTDSNGDYFFWNLAPGVYQVGIPTDQSTPANSGALTDWVPVPGSVNNPENTNFDNDGDAEAGFLSRSNDITLALGTEPTNEGADETRADAVTGTYANNNSQLRIDFVFEQVLYQIGNLVWLDTGAGSNYGNGVANSGESGISGVTVELFAASDTGFTSALQTTTTSAAGNYVFSNLPAGSYVVRIPTAQLPAGYMSAGTPVAAGNEADNDNNANVGTGGWNSGTIVVGPGSAEPTGELDGTTGTSALPAATTDNRANQTNDFGFVPTVRIGNQVWRDQSDNGPVTQVSTDNNGVFNAGETGLVGVTVQLWLDANSNGTFERGGADGSTPYLTTTTNSEGNYWFEGVRPGRPYFVVIPSIGSLVGANPSSSTGQSASVTTADNDDDGAPVGSDIAVSRVFTPSVSGNSTGEADAVEPGNIGGTADANAEAEANAAGQSYADNRSELRVDFGFVDVPVYRLGNLVWLDNGGSPYTAAEERNGVANTNEAGIAGVTVQLMDSTLTTVIATAVTDSHGKYAFENLVAGDYRVRILTASGSNATLLANLVSTTDGAAANADVDNDDNGAVVTGGWASSVVSLNAANAYQGGEPTNEVLRSGSASDDDNGASWTSTTSDPAFYNDNRSNFSIDFGFASQYRIGNLVWADLDNDGLAESGEPALSGVTVQLWLGAPTSGTLVGTTTTNGAGFYEFTGLAAGSYTVYLTGVGIPSGYTAGGTPVGANNDVDNDNNANTSGAGFSSGAVLLGGDAEPVNEVNRIGGADDDSAGYPDNRSNYSVDFGFWPGMRIGNLVWHDEQDLNPLTYDVTDRNGVVDSGEHLLSGVTVELWLDGGNGVFDGAVGASPDTLLGNDVTDAEGNYLFSGLDEGTYFVTIASLPSPYEAFRPSGVVGAVDNRNHGSTAANADNSVTYASVSSPIVLASGTEPTGEVDALPALDGPAEAEAGTGFRDNDSDLTIDFGFVSLPVIERDLALRKTPLFMTGSPATGTVTFLIEIFNQGTEDVEDVWVTDYIDAGSFANLTVAPAPGTTAGDAALPYTWDVTDPSTPVAFIDGVIPAGDSVTLSLTLAIAQPVNMDGLLNTAEISKFDSDGNSGNGDSSDGSVIDIDSIPDATNSDVVVDDETGLKRWTNAGSQRTENTTITDEDDHDIALIPVFDLALIKARGSSQDAHLSTPVPTEVTFDITVRNQGETAVYDVHVLDTPGAGLAISDDNSSDNVSGHTVTYLGNGEFVIDSLAPGEELTFSVLVDATLLASDALINRAEISGFDDDADDSNAKPSWVQDVDSTPDANPLNDAIELNGTVFPIDSHNDVDNVPLHTANLLDEDDHDAEAVNFALLRLGSTVYLDTNGNDIGDAGEEVAGVLVVLLDEDDNVIATTETDANGDYSFDELLPGTYRVGIPQDQSSASYPTVLDEFQPVPGSVASPEAENFDNDGDAEAGWRSLSDDIVLVFNGEPTNDDADDAHADALTTPRTYTDANSNLNIDFVFEQLTYELGNLVWRDTGAGSHYNNGIADADEQGIAGVTVELYRDNGAGAGDPNDGVLHADERIATTVTTAGGYYSFTGLLAADDYVVFIATDELPAGYGTAGLPVVAGNEVDNDNNGVVYGVTGWSSGPVSLGPSSVAEPLGEEDGTTGDAAQPAASVPDARANQTVDFGFVPSMRIGNQVWRDESDNNPQTQVATDNDGVFNGDEIGLGGVTVELWLDADDDGSFERGAADGATPLALTTTNSEGNYWFSNVRPDLPYFVVVPSVGSVALEVPASSSGQSASATAADNDDDGAPVGLDIAVSRVFTPSLAGASTGEEDANEPGDNSSTADPDAETEANLAGTPYADADSELAIDFGFVNVPAYRLGNLVWLDNGGSPFVPGDEANGVANSNEPGIPGVQVQLLASDGFTVLGTTLTDLAGEYVFENLVAGNYFVRIAGGGANAVPLNGLVSTPDGAPANVDVDNDDNGVLLSGDWMSSIVTLGAANAYQGAEPTTESRRLGEPGTYDTGASLTPSVSDPALYANNRSNLTVDFGFYQPYRIGNLVWNDIDNDGIHDLGEPGIPGIEVQLRNTSATVLATTSTDATGLYSFEGLAPGDYVVHIPAPTMFANTVLTGWATGGTPVGTADSDVDNDNNAVPVSGGWSSGTYTLGASAEPSNESAFSGGGADDDNDGFSDAHSNYSVDFGFWIGMRVGNLVWHDESDANPATFAVTDNNGIADPGEPVMPGAIVSLWRDGGNLAFGGDDSFVATDVSDAEGNYLFEHVAPGNYFVAVQLMAPYVDYVPSLVTGSADNRNHGLTAPSGLAAISPMLTLASGGTPVGEADAIPASDGSAEIEAGMGYRDIDSDLTFDFGFVAPPTYRVGNLVWRDADRDGIAEAGEQGIAGVLVQLLNGSGVVIGETVTDGGGRYAFTADASGNLLEAGDYRVRIPSDQIQVLGLGLTVDAAALANLRSTTDGGSTDVDNDDNGADFGGGWQSGPFTLGEAGPSFETEPTNERLRSNDGTDDDLGWAAGTDARSNFSLDFGFFPGLRLGDTVWYDDGRTGPGTFNFSLENDGVYQATELPAADVTVLLFGDDGDGVFEPGADDAQLGSTTTDVDGEYFFTGLDDATNYWVAIPDSESGAGQELENFRASTPSWPDGAGTNDRNHGIAQGAFAAVAPLVDLTRGGMTYGDGGDEANANAKTTFVLADGDSNLVVDFGFSPAPLYEVGNLVWLDADEDGVADSGELGIGAVSVQLFADDGDGVFEPGVGAGLDGDAIATDVTGTTGADRGRYEFTGLPAGRYFVHLPAQGVLEGLESSVVRSNDADDNVDNDNNGIPATGWYAAVELGPIDGAGELDEPLSEADGTTGESAEDGSNADGRSNQTVDFGFNYRVRIGNQVWLDESDTDPATTAPSDNNGVFDAGEIGLPGVTVELWRDSDGDGFEAGDDDVLLDSTTTDLEGNYVFHGLEAATDLYVAIEAVGAPFTTARSSAGQSGATLASDNDDDGAPAASYLSVSRAFDIAIGGAPTGEVDSVEPGHPAGTADDTAELEANDVTGFFRDVDSYLTADFGFVEVPLYRVGNLVWYDEDGDAVADLAEDPIAGVRVDLYADDDGTAGVSLGDTWLGATVTDANGKYAFENLTAGEYYVLIPEDQSDDLGGTLAGLNANALVSFVNSPGFSPASSDVDNLDDGYPVSGIGVASDPFTLGAGADDPMGTEPTDEVLRQSSATDDDNGWTGGPDDRSNFTIDFGFYQQLRLGNLVWLDNGGSGIDYDPADENNGIADPQEAGINGVTVALYASDGANGFDPGAGDTLIGLMDTATFLGTDGVYYFDDLMAGEYYVAIVGDEAVFADLRLANNPGGATESDDDDNDAEASGAIDTSNVLTLAWVSGAVTLEYGNEPTDEAGNFSDPTAGLAESGLNDFAVNTLGRTQYARGDAWSQLRVDFGFAPVPLYSLGNLVWEDWDNDGIAELGEPALAGVTVELYAAADTGLTTPLATEVTDADGQYQFTDLAAGDYVVHIPAVSGPVNSALSGWFTAGTPVADADGDVDNDNNGVTDSVNDGWTSGAVTLGEGDDNAEPEGESDGTTTDAAPAAPRDDRANQTVDFGFWRGLRLGNQVWLDEGAGSNQNNGIYDADEAPIAGVTVELWRDLDADGVAEPEGDDSAQTPLATVTDLAGHYYFANLAEGDYFATVATITGGGVESSTNRTGNEPSLTADGQDDGEALGAFLSVTPVYELSVGNATTGEVDGPGATGGSAEGAAYTATGFYPDANSYLAVDFGFINVPLYRIGNLVWNDYDNDGVAETGEPGIAGVTVELYRVASDPDDPATLVGSTLTSADGKFEFTSLAAGTYFVQVPDQSGAALAGYIPSSGAGVDAVANNDEDNDANGIALGSDQAVASGDVVLGPEATGGDPDVESASETLRADDATDDDAGASSPNRIDDDRSNFTVDFGYYALSLGNLVFFDTDGDRVFEPADGDAGIADVPVSLYVYNSGSSSWTLVDSTTTDANGLYLFLGLVSGEEYRAEIPASAFAPGGALEGLYSSIGSHGDIDTVTDDNVDRGADPASVYGAVISEGVLVSAAGEPTGESPDNNDVSVIPDASSNLLVDFGFYAQELGGVVWEDNGGEGLDFNPAHQNDGVFQTSTELAFEGVTLLLFAADGTTPYLRANGSQATAVTDAAGAYRFTGLPAGDYVVTIPSSQFAAAGVLNGFANSDGNDLPLAPPAPRADDDDLLVDNGYPLDGNIFGGGAVSATAVTLTPAGEPATDDAPTAGYAHTMSNLTVDFGFWNASIGLELGNQVWFDFDRDGIYDLGDEDPAPAGVVMYLYDVEADSIIQTTVTDANGQYLFSGLSAGRYRVGIAAINFELGGPFYKFTVTPVTSGNPDDEVDSDNNGLPLEDGSVWSEVVTLVAAAPMNEWDPASYGIQDRMSDLTVDFGIVEIVLGETGVEPKTGIWTAVGLVLAGFILLLVRRRRGSRREA